MMYGPGMQISQKQQDKTILQKLSLKIANFDIIQSPVTQTQLKFLISEALIILKESPTVLKLSLPVKIVGDVFGHYNQLIKIFETIGGPSQRNYLFLGNYVGKGTHSIESLATLLFFKIKYPENFFLLRGRSELPQNNFMFGFYDECATKFTHDLWTEFNDLFNHLPLAAVIDDQIFCSSSGIMPQIKTIEQLGNICKTPQIGQIPQIISFLSSRPKQPQQSKACFTQREQFSFDMLKEWLKQNNFSLMIRSNDVLEQGIEFSFDKMVLTICSIPNFLNVGNLGITVSINENCEVSFTALKSTK